MNVVLFDEELTWKNLLPLTFTRPVAAIRIGILTIREKWDAYLHTTCGYHSQAYLSAKFPLKPSAEFLLINSKFCPDPALAAAVKELKPGQALYSGGQLIAFHGAISDIGRHGALVRKEISGPVFTISHVWEIFTRNGQAIQADFELLTKGRESQPLSDSVRVVGDRRLVFLEKGARAEAAVFNTEGGPIYLGEHAEVMEGAMIRGPFALGEHSAVKMGAKIYGATTIGPHCKVGGEINNSVISGYSNKAHDGFLGNSVLGEWCNLGADTNNSNLKNNYGSVKLYNYAAGKAIDTGMQFCGLIMGDHSKSGINTMFNTGTVVGVGCNVFGGGFPDTRIPSFSWGGSAGFEEYRLDKFLETAARVYARRNLEFGEAEKQIFGAIYSGRR